MADRLEASAAVRARMSRQARRDTLPELQLRRALHARGFRYRLGWHVPGRPRRTMDIAFPGMRIGIFVDGCFWHACPIHVTWPQNNAPWWRAKLATNVARDRDTDEAMQSANWAVLRVWEHENVDEAVTRVVAAVSERRVESVSVRLAD